MKELIAKTITILICPFLAYGFGLEIYRIASLPALPKGATVFAVGFIAFAISWRIFKRHLQGVCTFEHELTHLLFGLLFLKKPRSFVVTRQDGGYVEMSGGNFVITLAPYFFPTVSYLLLPLVFFVSPEFKPIFVGIMGASVAFHLISMWGELHWRQTDLHDAGIAFSLIFLPVANLVFYGALFAAAIAGSEGVKEFWITGAKNSFGIFTRIFRQQF